MIFTARFRIGCWPAKDLLQWESVIYHSINELGFEGQVAKKFLNGIYCTYRYTKLIPFRIDILGLYSV